MKPHAWVLLQSSLLGYFMWPLTLGLCEAPGFGITWSPLLRGFVEPLAWMLCKALYLGAWQGPLLRHLMKLLALAFHETPSCFTSPLPSPLGLYRWQQFWYSGSLRDFVHILTHILVFVPRDTRVVQQTQLYKGFMKPNLHGGRAWDQCDKRMFLLGITWNDQICKERSCMPYPSHWVGLEGGGQLPKMFFL